MVECKLCGAEFKPEGIHIEVCQSCYCDMVNEGENFDGDRSGDDTAAHEPMRRYDTSRGEDWE